MLVTRMYWFILLFSIMQLGITAMLWLFESNVVIGKVQHVCRMREILNMIYINIFGIIYYDNVKLKKNHNFAFQSGAHFVKDPSTTETENDGVYINVCRNIQANSLEGCPAEAAACLKKNGNIYMLGAPTTGVNITNDRY